jgi:hypothetical protein
MLVPNENIMSKAWYENWTMNSFPSLLADAIAFDFQAQQKSTLDFPATNRYSKASVINAILSIEAAANSCIARMTYPEMVIQSAKRLTEAASLFKSYANYFNCAIVMYIQS